jgi:fructose-bisphosphate aldolase, class I
MASLNKILKYGRAIFLAYDQGLEHGPVDFNDKNVDPEYIINIANKGKYTGLILQKGIAEKYRNKIKVPLILKLNGKTSLLKGDPISTKLATVEEAIKLKASAVGYTIYMGSKHQPEMLEEFEQIQKKAHENKLPVILWAYYNKKLKYDKKLMAYCARVGLEIGADIVKLRNGTPKNVKWAVEAAGKTKVVMAGGLKTSEKELLTQIEAAVNAGAIGIAIGRNVWQHKDPLEITKKLKRIIWK